MAQRRMFSPEIVSSDAFLEMPASAQALYFQLGMYADDDGFVNPRKIMRMLGSSEDDLKILMVKNFVIPFDNGIIVIKHWRMNNLVRKDWYRPTLYTEQKEKLYIKKIGAYTLDSSQGEPVVNDSLTVRSRRLGKVSIVKKEIADAISSPLGIIEATNTDSSDTKAIKKQDPGVMALREKLYSILEKENGVRPTPNIGDYKQVQKALKNLTATHITEMVQDAIANKQVHTVRQVLTDREIDIKRQELV